MVESGPLGSDYGVRSMTVTSKSVSKITFQCQVCNEVARGYHFGAFTCEGCKSFFGRTCKPMKSNGERKGNGTMTSPIARVNLHCKNGGKCNVQGRNRTSCKFCRFNKCIEVGMAPQSEFHKN
ncbi:hypothetical protein AB6A40_007417 [Gnathostoma spinigerum]|uniref:Nuclear receptor domain-containing protein n=1 Tax=Gnathostoma spinigerum TaxID=75299 RepID=A0ABD6EL55_9BILA